MKILLYTAIFVLLLATSSQSSTHTQYDPLRVVAIEYGPEVWYVDGNGCLVVSKSGKMMFNRAPSNSEYWEMHEQLHEVPHSFKYSRRHYNTWQNGNVIEWEMSEEEI